MTRANVVDDRETTMARFLNGLNQDIATSLCGSRRHGSHGYKGGETT
jgi:hypothetical protein